jgi:hypothetical protein
LNESDIAVMDPAGPPSREVVTLAVQGFIGERVELTPSGSRSADLDPDPVAM